jgi:membrane fusion protein, multidrug efflux system
MRTRIIFAVVAALLLCAGIFFWSEGARLPAVESGQAATNPQSTQTTNQQASTGPQASAPAESRTPATGPDAKPVPVVATTVHQGNVPVYISGLGTVQALYTIHIKAQVDGVILKMPFAEGQDVKEGDTLVLIDPSVFQARLEQAQAQKERAEAQLENAKTNLWRDQELLKHDFATQKQTDQERMLVGQYTADIAQYEADIKYWQAQLAYTNIRSPINGRIGIRNVDPGNLIRAQDNTDLVTLVQLQPISVIITVPAKELARNGVSLGQVNLPVTAYAENGVTPLGRGQVHTVNVEVNQTTGTVKLKAEFNNEQYKLWPGDFVDCKIVVEQRTNGLTVPTAAIRHGPRGDFVWLIQPDNTVAIRPVRVRQTVGGTAVIDTGLDADEKIVLDGYARLAQGSRVEIVPPRSGDGSRLSRVE